MDVYTVAQLDVTALDVGVRGVARVVTDTIGRHRVFDAQRDKKVPANYRTRLACAGVRVRLARGAWDDEDFVCVAVDLGEGAIEGGERRVCRLGERGNLRLGHEAEPVTSDRVEVGHSARNEVAHDRVIACHRSAIERTCWAQAHAGVAGVVRRGQRGSAARACTAFDAPHSAHDKAGSRSRASTCAPYYTPWSALPPDLGRIALQASRESLRSRARRARCPHGGGRSCALARERTFSHSGLRASEDRKRVGRKHGEWCWWALLHRRQGGDVPQE